jgi:hypothetical protein
VVVVVVGDAGCTPEPRSGTDWNRPPEGRVGMKNKKRQKSNIRVNG